MRKKKPTDTAALELTEVVARLAEARIGFQLVYFPDSEKPSRRYAARCEEEKFFASDPVAALLAAVSHFMADKGKSVKEGEAMLVDIKARLGKVGELLPNLPAHAKKPDGSCSECGQVHRAPDNPLAQALSSLMSGAVIQAVQAKKKDDDGDKEN